VRLHAAIRLENENHNETSSIFPERPNQASGYRTCTTVMTTVIDARQSLVLIRIAIAKNAESRW